MRDIKLKFYGSSSNGNDDSRVEGYLPHVYFHGDLERRNGYDIVGGGFIEAVAIMRSSVRLVYAFLHGEEEATLSYLLPKHDGKMTALIVDVKDSETIKSLQSEYNFRLSYNDESEYLKQYLENDKKGNDNKNSG